MPVVTTLSDKGLSRWGASITHSVGKVEVIDSDKKARGGNEVGQLSWTVWGRELKRFLVGVARRLTADASGHAVVIMVAKTVGGTGRSTGQTGENGLPAACDFFGFETRPQASGRDGVVALAVKGWCKC